MIRFVVPAMEWDSPKTGKSRQVIDGYYAQGKRPNKTRLWRYVAWKVHVQECASKAGLELPLRPTKTLPSYIITTAFFETGTHPDPENVHKSCVDALCYVSRDEHIKKGSDKYTGGLFFAPQYDKEHPRVEVNVLTEKEFAGMVLAHYIAVMDRLIAKEKKEELL